MTTKKLRLIITGAVCGALLNTILKILILVLVFRFLIISVYSPVPENVRMRWFMRVEQYYSEFSDFLFYSSEEKAYQQSEGEGHDTTSPGKFYIPFDYLSVKKSKDSYDPVNRHVYAKYNIITNGSLGPNVAYFYIGNRMKNEFICGEGVWVSVSRDNGKSYTDYFSGLEYNNPYSFLDDQSFPLWKNDSVLQVRAQILKMTSPETLPAGPPPEYAVVEDSLIIEINLNRLSKDSDHDGLTDVLEAVWMTDPFSRDTDKDGIPDLADMNPRFKNVTGERSLLYRAAISGYIRNSMRDAYTVTEEGLDAFLKSKNSMQERTGVVILVTDDPCLQEISPVRDRLIILSSKEQREWRKKYRGSFSCDLWLSPLFKCDWIPGFYKLTIGFRVGEDNYLVRKVKNGWKVRYWGGYII